MTKRPMLGVAGRDRSGSVSYTQLDVYKRQVPFHPYYTAKDGFGLGVFLMIFVALTLSLIHI